MKLKLVCFGLFLLIFINFISCNRFKTDYASSVRDAYKDSISKSWKLKELKNEKPVVAVPEYIKVVPIKNPVILNRYSYRDFSDSLIKARNIDKKDYKILNKLNEEVSKMKVGPIDKWDAIKSSDFQNYRAIIYTNNKYNDFSYDGYWLALSNDKGKNWKRYYTGLTENKNYYFKNNSKIPLWKDSNTIQIEAAIVRKIADRINLLSAEKFGTIRDSIALQLDISKIILDSDSDGLTDIVEERMLLNPKNPDTDGDGIIDSKDKNPRFKSKKSPKSILYEVLMGNYKFEDPYIFQIDLNNLPKNKYSNSNKTDAISIFVTDDNDIKGLDLKDETLIVMTSKEYNKYMFEYPFSFRTRNYSQMFLCNNEDDIYIIDESDSSSGTTYLVKKTDKGREVSFLEGYNI